MVQRESISDVQAGLGCLGIKRSRTEAYAKDGIILTDRFSNNTYSECYSMKQTN